MELYTVRNAYIDKAERETTYTRLQW